MNAALKKKKLWLEQPRFIWRESHRRLETPARIRGDSGGSGPRWRLNKANPRALSSHRCQRRRRQPPLCVVVSVQAPGLQRTAPWSSRSTASCPRSCSQPFLSSPASASCSASCVSPSTSTTATSGEWTPGGGEGVPTAHGGKKKHRKL